MTSNLPELSRSRASGNAPGHPGKPTTGMTFVVARDWRGDLPWTRAVVDAASAAGAELILHVGDLAVLWPGRDKGKFDGRLQQRLELREPRSLRTTPHAPQPPESTSGRAGKQETDLARTRL